MTTTTPAPLPIPPRGSTDGIPTIGREHFTAAERQSAAVLLRELLPVGATFSTLYLRRMPSGMAADYAVLAIVDSALFLHSGPAIRNLSGYVAAVLGWSITPEAAGYYGVRVKGCGLSRPDHLCRELAYALHGDPAALKCDTL